MIEQSVAIIKNMKNWRINLLQKRKKYWKMKKLFVEKIKKKKKKNRK